MEVGRNIVTKDKEKALNAFFASLVKIIFLRLLFPLSLKEARSRMKP